MPANKKEDQERRREAIRNLLLSGKFPLEDLKAVVEMLKVLGIPASPASVSRDLRELGAVRVKGYYKIPVWEDEDGKSPFRKVIVHIDSIVGAGPYQTMIITHPGFGHAVAEAIRASKWDEIVGVLADPSSVLVATQDKILQQLLFDRLRYLREVEFAEEEPEDPSEKS
jgi:transcriptional regulator of arginine metabolism